MSNPYGFADPVSASGGGGLGINELTGWYGLSSLSAKFGATDGDQTTGGQISFGVAGSSNRALGLLATSSTGATAFGAKFVNQTAQSPARRRTAGRCRARARTRPARSKCRRSRRTRCRNRRRGASLYVGST